ncbi:cupin domain-containing protein [Amycolatopsis rhabdoformis]|uniref:Cupin domain-containing protein n=1 Tax=Amycolatopsis rhabdoformis TaxID=1448059 RepID=A0ABZ1IIV3_9PSEU|nr:cupin domain-containing protein [Amycolatopsis rhabdoformis]WSE34207.1 cupin domain-containing protein [Amycolatopsis rhabdoformis]
MDDRIGPALREARIRQKQTLRGVALATGLSASLLSQVETGKSQPSVSTLYALVSHLGLSLDALLGLEVEARGAARDGAADAGRAPDSAPESASRPAGPVQRAADNPVLDMDNGVRWERLAVHEAQSVEPLLVTYQPGASSSADGGLMRHPGAEHAYLLDGELSLRFETETHVLRAGDSISFASDRPHLYVNHTTEPARGLWFVVGRTGTRPDAGRARERIAGPPAELLRLLADRQPVTGDEG